MPEAHYLETWGDAAAPDGTATVQQPMIQPLYCGRTRGWNSSRSSTGYKDQSGYDIVRNYWIASSAARHAAEKTWRKSLHDGVIARNSGCAEVKPTRMRDSERSGASSPQPAADSGVEVVFVPELHRFTTAASPTTAGCRKPGPDDEAHLGQRGADEPGDGQEAGCDDG